MNRNIISLISSPIISYFQATIGLSCSSWIPEEDFSPNTESAPMMSKKALEVKANQSEKYSYRPRKSSFSLRLCIQRQREMASPKQLEGQDGWIEEELILAATATRHPSLTQ